MKTFINEELSAPNVLKIPVDLGATQQLGPIATSKWARRRLYSKAPPWRSDIRWYSARFKRDFDRFRSLFEQLGIARHVEPYVDFRRGLRLYNGFLVVRRHCSAPNFHVDWDKTGNQAFTLMTPLTENCQGFGLLYRKLDGSIGEYEYKRGEALVFGDDFEHSTKPGHSDEPVVFLCFNFGTDKMESWPRIERTAARQGLLTCQPDGRFQRLPVNQRIRNVVGPLLRKAGLRSPPSQRGY